MPYLKSIKEHIGRLKNVGRVLVLPLTESRLLRYYISFLLQNKVNVIKIDSNLGEYIELATVVVEVARIEGVARRSLSDTTERVGRRIISFVICLTVLCCD